MKLYLFGLATLCWSSSLFAAQANIYLFSDVDEPLLKGKTIEKTVSDVEVFRDPWADQEGVGIRIPDGDMEFEFFGPPNERLQAKTYDYIRDDRENLPRSGSFAVSVDHWTVSRIQGRFRIDEIHHDQDGRIDQLAVDFIENSPTETDKDRRTLKGSIRYNSAFPITTPIEIPAAPDPVNRPHSEITFVDFNGKLTRHTNQDGDFYITDYLPDKSIGFENERAIVQFGANYGAGGDVTFDSSYEPLLRGPLKTGYFEKTEPACPGCQIVKHWIRILEIGRDKNGLINQLALDVGSEERGYKMMEFVRYHSDLPVNLQK